MTFRKTIFTLSVIVGVAALFLSLDFCKPYRKRLKEFVSYSWNGILGSDNDSGETKTGKLFTENDLKKNRGENGGDVYLSILGQVFDVTKGRKHYGPGGGYHFFTGSLHIFHCFIVALYFLSRF